MLVTVFDCGQQVFIVGDLFKMLVTDAENIIDDLAPIISKSFTNISNLSSTYQFSGPKLVIIVNVHSIIRVQRKKIFSSQKSSSF